MMRETSCTAHAGEGAPHPSLCPDREWSRELLVGSWIGAQLLSHAGRAGCGSGMEKDGFSPHGPVFALELRRLSPGDT